MITKKYILDLSNEDLKRLAMCRELYHNHPKKVSAKVVLRLNKSEKNRWEIISSSEASPAEFFDRYKMGSFAKIDLKVNV